MKLSSRKKLLKESELTLKSIKKSLNEGTIIVKRKPIEEPYQYVIRCHTKPNQSMIDAGLGKNVKPGDFIIFDEGMELITATNDINKATIFKKKNLFSWGKNTIDASLKYFKDFFDVDGLTGDFYEPVPVDVKMTKTVTIRK